MSKEVAVKKENTPRLATDGGLVAFLDEPEFQQDAGKGISKSAADKQVPMMRVLQSGSPQVKRTNPAYVEGAEEGMILLRGAPVPLVRSIPLFQPCHFTKHVVEWIPRDQGSGFVGRHAFQPSDNEQIAAVAQRLGARQDRENKFKYVLPDGHELIETRYMVGQAIFDVETVIPFVIPFTGSGHSVIRTWEQSLDQEGRRRAAFAMLYALNTRAARNAKGDWYILDPVKLGRLDTITLPFPADAEWRRSLYFSGKALYESLERGEREIAPDEASAEDLGETERRAAI